MNQDENPEEGTELEEGTQPTSKDPLDDIEDVEELRNRAKGYRSERNRLKREGVEKLNKPDDKPEGTSDFLSKKDFHKANERNAMKSLESDAFFKEHKDDIVKLYVARQGKETPEDIVEDLRDAITLYKARNPQPSESGAEALSETTGGGTGGITPTEKEKEEPPNFGLPRQPDSWYQLSDEQKEKIKSQQLKR